jgi:4-alpha-glucanotransferase
LNVIPRIAGILIPLSSIRARNDAGIGDIAALSAMAELAAAMGNRAILLLPLDETAPGMASPYSALSLFAIDPIYIGIDGLSGIAPEATAAVRHALRDVPLSERAKIRAARLELLEAAFRHFESHAGGAERGAVEEFAARNRGWLDDYALFRALKQRFNFAAWEEWPAELCRREPRALDDTRRELSGAIAKFVYWQYLAHRRWAEVRAHARGRGVMLGGDLAFSPARDSAEVWAHAELFDLTRTVGAPPDAFNPEGQRWGLPAPRWKRMRAAGFALLRERVRHARELYDFLRVDHVVGLYRTFSFDASRAGDGIFSPADEPQQRAQGETIVRAILDEAGGTVVVAEDLGVIPPFVRASLAALGVPGYKVMRWEKTNRGTPDEAFIPPAEYPELSLATTGTHDTETLAVWWEEASADERRQMLRMLGRTAPPAGEARVAFRDVHDAILAALYAAPSRLVIVPIQDLFGWRDRINLPGTVSSSNWAWRMPMIAEDMTNSAFAPRIAQLCKMIKGFGR